MNYIISIDLPKLNTLTIHNYSFIKATTLNLKSILFLTNLTVDVIVSGKLSIDNNCFETLNIDGIHSDESIIIVLSSL